MKKILAAATATLVSFSGLLAAQPAHAVPTVAWDVDTLDWQLVDNPDSAATDVYSRPKATITYQWSTTDDSSSDCVAWHVDGNVTPAFTTTLSNNAETNTNWNIGTAAGTASTDIVYDWTEIVEKLSLDHTTTHTIVVEVHNVACNLADFNGESVTGSDTLNITSASSATPQGWDWSASLALTEDVANTTEQPSLGGTPNADDWIYPGEDATFEHQWISSSGSTWDGPINYIEAAIDSTSVCVIDVVNQDDSFVDPETANVSRGYDYMNIGWTASSITHENGDGELTYSNPRAQTSSTTYAWNSLISSGFNSGAYSFDPTQVNSITRYIFQGGCYDTFNYGTASGSAANTTTAVNPATNWSSEQRYLSTDSPSAPIVNYREWNYYWHPRSADDIRADIWAARGTAISSETLYLGPAETSVSTDNPSVARGESVNLSRDWFDGDGQCIAVFVNGTFFDSDTVSTDGPGDDATNYTFEQLVTTFELDNTVENTIEWRIFGQSCSAIDETTATAASTTSITTEADESTIVVDVSIIGPGDEITIDSSWFDGDAQCLVLYVDGVVDDSGPAGPDGSGTDSSVVAWEEFIDNLGLDPTVEHTIEYRIFNGDCDGINFASPPTPMASVSFDLEPIEPSVEFDVPQVGPGESVVLDVSWGDLHQCIAVFVDEQFLYWGEIAPPDSDSYGTYSSETTWYDLMVQLEIAVGEPVDWSIEHTISYRIFDDISADPDNCLGGVEPTLELPALDTADLTLLPLAPVLEPSDEEVDPNEESTLDVDRDTYGNLMAAHYIDGVFVGCVIVANIPETVNWDSLDESYSRDSEHDVTYEIFPIFEENIDVELCDEGTFAEFEPLTTATVTLVPANLAETGFEFGALGWFGAAVLLIGGRLAFRRRARS